MSRSAHRAPTQPVRATRGVRRLLTGVVVVATLAASAGIARADNITDDIVDSGTGVTLVAGSSTGGVAKIRVIGNGADGTLSDAGCNWDTGEAPLVLDVVTPSGVTAS